MIVIKQRGIGRWGARGEEAEKGQDKEANQSKFIPGAEVQSVSPKAYKMVSTKRKSRPYWETEWKDGHWLGIKTRSVMIII